MLFSRNRGKAPLFPPSLNETQLKKWEETGPLYEEVERSSRNGGARYRRVKNGSYQLLNSDSNGEATILCVGDILCEDRMYQTHRISSRGGGFEFDSVYSLVRPVIAECDLAIANLETNVCEKSPYTGEQYKVEGKYHNNAPVEFLDAIKNAGFDFLMLANNHSLDSGVNGAMETLRRIDERGMMRTGLFSPDESLRGVVVEVNGISVGLLSYSTWYNRNESRLTEIGRRQIINMYDVNRVREDIETIRSRGAEFVLVYMHWGVDAEYKQVPSKSMKEQAKEVANAGADYIIGSHTHSVQPYATITTDDQRSVPCFFSMGNFVTSERASIARNSILLKLKLKRGAKGKVEVARESIIPCHVPDRLLNLHYPVVPDVEGIGNAPSMEECRSSFSSTSKIVDYENGKLGSTYQLTKAKLCEILDLPKPEVDEEYASLRFAKDSVKGCASIVCDITSDPSHVTPRTRFEGLAKEAMDKGAKLLISSEQIKDYPCLLVEDPFAAYCKVIAEIRRFFSPRTICITGSIGKTSTTEMVRAVIRSKCSQTHFNTGSANSVRYSGTVIQGLKAGHKFYVQELMEGPPYGAASTISKLVQPQASIVTVVGSSHLEYFGTQERILESCLGVQDGMPDDGLLILNADDPFQKAAQPRLNAMYYGIEDPSADYRAINIRGVGDEMRFDVVHEGASTEVALHCFGKHNVLNALAAFVAGRWAGMTEKEIVHGLSQYRTAGIRQNLVKWGGYSLYLDCYNSSLESVKSAFEAFSMIETGSNGRHIAVLADVKEVGEDWQRVHEEIGRVAACSCADILIFYGECSRYSAQAARAAGKESVRFAESEDSLIAIVEEVATPSDIVLFKGSHGMALEHVVDKIWGTWYHEEFERYDFLTRVVSDDNLEYRIYTDHVTVQRKRSSASSVVIPDEIEGLPVEGIAASVFNRSRYTESVKLPSGLRNIRYCAFYKANKITRVHVPSSVRIIDASAFSTCENLVEVIIDPGCTHIGRRAFGNCNRLSRIVIPETVTQIGPEALINCDNVKVFGIPGSYAESYASLNGIPFSPIIGGERLRPLRPQVDESIRCILVDVDKGILFEHRADERAQIASLSKIPLLLFVLKRIEEGEMSKESIVSFGEEVTFGSLGGSSPSANSTVRGRIDGSQRYLHPGESSTLESLLYGMMALSGNDAAAAVAKFAAGSEERYLEWANGPMKSEYSLSDNTFFGRAYGRDCYSTAEDLGKLVRAMLQDANLSSLLWQYAGATETAGKVAIVGTDGECDLVSRKNTHPFISGPYRDWIEYYIGDECEVCGKTGTWIVEHSLITVVRSKGRTLLCVVAAAPNATLRDETTLSLFSWGFSSKE